MKNWMHSSNITRSQVFFLCYLMESGFTSTITKEGQVYYTRFMTAFAMNNQRPFVHYHLYWS